MRLRNKPWVPEYLNLNQKYLINWIPDQGFLNLSNLFENKANINLEIGCGKGNFITNHALGDLNNNYIGMEKETTVVGVALKKSLSFFEKNNIKMNNLKYFNYYAEDLSIIFEPSSIDKIYLNFSDPWPKLKHEKKRLTHNNFLNIYARIIKSFGILEFKTDNDKLFEFSIEQISQNPNWIILEQTSDLYNNEKLLKDNISTEYETKFHTSGKNINKVIIKKKF